MTAQEAGKFRQEMADLRRALLREQMDRRELENRVRKLENRIGELDRPAGVAEQRAA